MAKAEIFHQDQVVGSLNLDASRISGSEGPDFPTLIFPIEIHIHPTTRGEEIILIQLKGDLFLDRRRVSYFISDYLIFESGADARGRNASLTISVPIDPWKIERIEEKRRGDLHVMLDGNWFYILRTKKLIRDHEHVGWEFFSTRFNLTFNIIHSLWVEKILPELGYGKIKILEIPYPEKTMEGVFEKALQELEQAMKYFKDGDYDKTVGHCRSAIELIPNLRPLSARAGGYPEKSRQFAKEHLGPLIGDSKSEAFEKVLNALWDLAAIPHHPYPPGYFNRADAEFSFLVTSASLGYVGKLLSRK